MSLLVEVGRPVVESLLPKFLVDQVLEQPTTYQTSECLDGREIYVAAVSLLVVNTVLGALKALKQQNFVALDANPGDGGCQNRALELRRLAQLDLSSECRELEKQTAEVKLLVTRRKGNLKEIHKCSAQRFFRERVGTIAVSKNMEFILHCFLSKVLRTPHTVLATGVVMTKSEISKLSILSDKIHFLNTETRSKIVEGNQQTLSLLTMEALRRSSLQIQSIQGGEKELLMTMLSEEQTKIYSPSARYESKAFGCLFYCVKAVLLTLREERAVVCVRSIVPKGGKSFDLHFQSPMAGKEFEVLESEIPKSTLITVFEVVAEGSLDESIVMIAKHGFTNLVLAQAALVPPYEPTSTITDVKVKEAVDEIKAFQELAEKIGPGIELDHIYTMRKG